MTPDDNHKTPSTPTGPPGRLVLGLDDEAVHRAMEKYRRGRDLERGTLLLLMFRIGDIDERRKLGVSEEEFAKLRELNRRNITT